MEGAASHRGLRPDRSEQRYRDTRQARRWTDIPARGSLAAPHGLVRRVIPKSRALDRGSVARWMPAAAVGRRAHTRPGHTHDHHRVRDRGSRAIPSRHVSGSAAFVSPGARDPGIPRSRPGGVERCYGGVGGGGKRVGASVEVLP